MPVWAAEARQACWPKVQCRAPDTSQILGTPREPLDSRIGHVLAPQGTPGLVGRRSPGSRDMRTLSEEGLVFSLGLSYGRGRAFSALGATASGPMRRISREA